MATLKELEDALIKADAAGNAADAKVFADEIRRMRAAPPAAQERDFNKGPSTGRQAFTQGLLGNPQGITIADDPTLMKAIADGGLEAGGAALGQVVGGLAPGPLKPVGMAAGRALGGAGGNLLAQSRRIAMGEQEGYQPGQAVGAGVASIIPGGNMAKAPVRAALKGAATNLAAGATESVIDRGELPSGTNAAAVSAMGAVAPGIAKLGAPAARAQTKAIEDAVFKQTVQEAVAAGLPINPTNPRLNPSFLTRRIADVAGAAATKQETAIRAQVVTNALMRKELGLPVNEPLTEELLQTIRKQAAAPYEQISKLSKQAAKDITALNAARSEARGYHYSYKSNANYDHLLKAKKADAKVQALEQKIGAHATAAGRAELVDEIKEARKLIAKSYQIEEGLGIGSGDVSAGVLLRSANSGEKVSGNLKTVAKYADAFRSESRDAAAVPTPGISQLGAAGAAMGGAGGVAMTGSPVGLLGAGIPLLRDPARKLLLSDWYQKRAINRFLNPPAPSGPESALPLAFRLGGMSAGRNAFLER